MKSLNPDSIAAPFGRYSHGVAIDGPGRLVATSGQLGLQADGELPQGAYAQAVQCFANCSAILAQAGMTPADAVRINAFVTDRAHFAEYMRARDEWLTGLSVLPASTLVIVTGFTRAEFLVEVEVTAFRAHS